jgi:hypothetical protein
MKASFNRVAKTTLLCLVGLMVVFLAHAVLGAAYNRTMDRKVRDALARVAEGRPVEMPEETEGGRISWRVRESDEIIVRETTVGYQSKLDLLLLLDGDLALRRFALVSGHESAFANRSLATGEPDAFSHATTTAHAIRQAAARARNDLLRSEENTR